MSAIVKIRKKHERNIRHNHLEAAGLTKLSHLENKSAAQITAIRGLGAQSAQDILSALAQFKAAYVSKTKMPLYDDLKKADHKLLKALADLHSISKIKIDRIGFQSEIDKVELLCRSLHKPTAWHKLLFIRGTSRQPSY